MKTSRAAQFKVGMLILMGLTALGGAILLLGQERRLFENRVGFEIRYTRTNGLKEGAPVSLSGVTVGSVESMTFPEDLRQNYISVRIRVVGTVAPRIHRDTVARIRTLGVLGDKFIELSGGSVASQPLPPGGTIASVNPLDYEALLGEGGDVVQNFIEATTSLKAILKSVEQGQGLVGELLTSEEPGQWLETVNNLKDASVSLKRILSSVEKGEGIAGQLIRGGDVGLPLMEDLSLSLSQLRSATLSLKETAEKLERGEGTLGTLIHEPEAGREILSSLKRSVANLEALTLQLLEGGGLLQRLIGDRLYANRVLGDLENTTRHLARITGKIDRGEGTVGALINDPQLYDRAREILAQVQGSWLLSFYRFLQNVFPSVDEQPIEGRDGEDEQGGL